MHHSKGQSLLFLLLLLPLIALAVYNANTKEKQAINTRAQTSQPAPSAPTTTVVAKNLAIPWAIAFLPDNSSMLVTERAGKVKLVTTSGQVSDVITIADVVHQGEGGLLGITLHPEFPTNKFVYVYYTYGGTGSGTLNKVVRYTYNNNQFTSPTTIVDAIPGASNHNGGRIKFGPDGFLYIATGDAANPSLAQDQNTLAGKILRVTDAGQPAPGNPFNNRTYSYGHRNPQGLAWNGGTMYATEHGESFKDELNVITAGKNYGWPTIQGDEKQTGLESPLAHSGSNSWAPSGTAFLNGSVFFAMLRGTGLVEAVPQGTTATIKEHFKGQFGRIREVIVSPNNELYITTSNKDGRGTVQAEDDKIIKVSFGLGSPTLPPQIPSGQSNPTFGVIAPCPSCTSQNISPTVSSPMSLPSGGASAPTGTTISGAPVDPCAENASLAHDRKKKKHKKHSGEVSQFTEMLIEFLLKLILLILQLFGTGQVPQVPSPGEPGGSPMPDPCDPPGSDIPLPSSAVPSTGTPNNGTPNNGAPTLPPVPTSAGQPTVILPTRVPTPTRPVGFTPVSIAPQPTNGDGFTPNRPDPAACTLSGQACNPNKPCCGGSCRPAINTPGDPGICD